MNFFKKMFAPVDMTEGTPWEKIALFAVPMIIGNFAQQMYSTVDSIVVGRYIGDNALAAVGSAAPILNLLIVLFVGISVGASIMVSQYVGAKAREELASTIANCIILTGIASLGIMIAGVLITRPLLVLLKTPESIIGWCASYLIILFVGAAGCAYYNILGGVLRGLGDSISALIYLIICCVVNIVLDILFVATFQWGVNGVAIATIIAQMFSGILCLRKLFHMKEYFELKKECFRINGKHMNGIIRLGLPSGITQALFSIAMIIVQSLTNSFGEMFIAANVIVMRVDGFAMLPNFSFGTALTTYAGQNIGADKMERVEKGAKQGTIMAVATSGVITLIILLFGRNLMGIFTETEELVDLGMRMMKILALGYLAMGVTQSLSGVMRGAGDTLTPMWIAIIQTFLIRVPIAYGISYFTRSPELPFGYQECVFISLLVAWLFGATLTTILYRKGNWKKKAI